MASPKIFISYRRDDSAGHAGRLFDNLVKRYGNDNVFMDLTIEPGVDFVDTLENAVGSCSVLLAVIGRYWVKVTNASTRRRRLENPNDFVRVEIASALRRSIRVIPVLVHRATMPNADDLPDDLKPFARRQAHELSDQRWEYDVGNLVSVIDKIVGYTETTPDILPWSSTYPLGAIGGVARGAAHEVGNIEHGIASHLPGHHNASTPKTPPDLAEWTCSNCGKKNAATLSFCSECGASKP